jgi:uncharacterized membrane protein YgcG
MNNKKRAILMTMKPLSIKICLLLGLLISATSVFSRPSLNNLDIKVVLSKNGDARITETREMYIDDEGTECYIGLANMGESQVKDLTVSDETGTRFLNVDWDVDETRDWKTYKCGIVTTNSGYEVCWGLGEEGERTYITSYTITGLVRGYPDADAIRHVFLDTSVSPKPDHAKITIMTADTTIVINPDSCGIWGFRFEGNLWFENGTIMAETTQPMSSEAGLFIMVQFPKGMFEPTIWENDTFENKKGEAFEGSDYASSDDDEDMTWFEWVIFFLIYGVSALAAVCGFVWHIYTVWRARRRANKDLMWYRDIPLNGNLQEANNILNAYKYMHTDYNNLMSACILKLIQMGAITIETRPNMKGEMEPNFVIHQLKDLDNQPVLMRKIFKIFKQAAGSDTVLEAKELKQYMKSTCNQSITDSFINTLHTKTSISKYKDREDEVRQLFGLRKFLKEFTLLDERGVDEVKLWKDYMVYATLFGIADRVIKEMKKVNPEFFNMDQVANQMADNMTLPLIYSTLHHSTSSAVAAKAAREHRSSGGGGHSSWGGGGGGFSGGGGGGGVR